MKSRTVPNSEESPKLPAALWGSLLSYIWIGSFEIEPLIYKLTDRHYSKWQITKHWICEDGFTPRTYTFADLASNERFIFMKEEPSDDLSYPEDCHVSLPCPNIGTQFLGDSSFLILLQDGWGFDRYGKIAYFGKGYNQLVAQTKLDVSKKIKSEQTKTHSYNISNAVHLTQSPEPAKPTLF